MIGKQIKQYKILEKIGEGGMGVVYKAEDTTLQRIVALKFLASYSGADEQRKSRLIQEARAAATLDHPNICTVYEIGEAEGHAFLAMAFVDGATLAERVHASPLEAAEFLGLAIQIAGGLKEAHERGIIHHDIKSSNIMVSVKGKAKLMDFGIAELATGPRPGRDGDLAGTAAYMSPERTRNEPGDQRSDVWSLGVVFYEMLTGMPPFRGEYEAAVLYSVMNEDPEPLQQRNPQVPEEIADIVHKALRKDPSDRYQNVANLLSDLETARAHLDQPSSEPFVSVFGASLRRDHGQRRPLRFAALALALTAILAAWWHFRPRSDELAANQPAGSRPSIAVLPLQDLSPRPGEEFFADGMTEELITNLAKIRGLRVISRTSVMQYRDSVAPLSEIAGALDVAYVMEGSVLRDQERVRINAKLIDAGSGENLWAESYDRDLKGVLDLQREVARSIAAGISVQLTPSERVQLSASQSVNARAYEDYLRGRHMANRRTAEALDQAADYFRAVIANDPDSALGYSGLADVFILQASSGQAPPDELWPQAKSNATRALQLDSSLAEAHSSMGLIHSFYEWQWEEAEREFQRAIDLNPGDATAHHRFAAMLSRLGRHDEAIAEIQRARELDPLSLAINNAMGVLYYMARRYDEGIEQLNRNRTLSPDYYRTYWNLGRCYLQKNQHPRALEAFERARELSNNNSFMVAALAHCCARAGQRERAEELLGELRGASDGEYISAMSMALVYIGLGDNQTALDWLEKALSEQAGLLVWLRVDPEFDPLRSEPRFRQILGKVGLDF